MLPRAPIEVSHQHPPGENLLPSSIIPLDVGSDPDMNMMVLVASTVLQLAIRRHRFVVVLNSDINGEGPTGPMKRVWCSSAASLGARISRELHEGKTIRQAGSADYSIEGEGGETRDIKTSTRP